MDPTRDSSPCGIRPRVSQALGHELPRQVGRHGVVDDGDDSEPELWTRPDLVGARRAHERRLDGVRDALLHLGGVKRGRLGDDHHLVVGEVGEGFSMNCRYARRR